jgi:hypothetical protein
MIAERLSSVSSAKGIKKRQCFRIPLGSRSSHLEQCECVRMDGWMDGWMDAFITHACRWMDAVLNFMLAEPRAIAPLSARCYYTLHIRRADVSVTGSESTA